MTSVKQAYCDFLNTSEGINLYRQFKRLLYGQDDSLVQWLNSSIIEHLTSAKEPLVKVCDIGGGDGERINKILCCLQGKFRNTFKLDFIEQSPLYAADFDPKPLATFCETEIYKKRFEEIILPEQEFDLIFLIHSIFAFDNGSSISKVLSLRRPNGKVIVVSNSPGSFLGGLKCIVDEELADKRYELDDLEFALQKRGINYERNTIVTEWSITNERLKGGMDILLNWISLGRYNSFSALKKQEIDEYISCLGTTNGVETTFREEDVALTIPSTFVEPITT